MIQIFNEFELYAEYYTGKIKNHRSMKNYIFSFIIMYTIKCIRFPKISIDFQSRAIVLYIKHMFNTSFGFSASSIIPFDHQNFTAGCHRQQ